MMIKNMDKEKSRSDNKSMDGSFVASEDASALGTNAGGKPVSGKPKRN